MVVIQEGSPISTEELWSSVRVTIGFLVTSLTKALLSLVLRPALGRVLVVPKLLPFKNYGGHCVLGDLQCCIFWYPSPDLCLDTILSRSSMDNSFDLMAWFLL